MEDTKIARKYLKHIIKNAFGNHGLRKLKIIYVWDAIIYSNIYQIGGLFIRISVSISATNTLSKSIPYSSNLNYSVSLSFFPAILKLTPSKFRLLKLFTLPIISEEL